MGLNLTEHCLKVVKRVTDPEKIAHELVSINKMQFCFVPGWGTTDDVIFILQQLQEKHLTKDKNVFYLHRPRKGF